MGCGGCGESKYPSMRERRLARVQTPSTAKSAIYAVSDNVMAVVVRMEGTQRLIGTVTGWDYGLVSQGHAQIMAVADVQADPRLAKATQETLRLARLK